MNNYHIISLPRCGTKSTLGLITDRMRRESTIMTIGTKSRPNSSSSGAQIGEFLHGRNRIAYAYPESLEEPAFPHALRIKADSMQPPGYKFFDYEYDEFSDTLMWTSTMVKRVYTTQDFNNSVKIIQKFKKPWIIKTFPSSFVNNKYYQTSVLDVRRMLKTINQISTPVILTRDFKSWVISLYFGIKFGKFSPSQLTTEFLNGIKPQNIPQAFIDAQSKQYRIFTDLIDTMFPDVKRYNVKDIFADSTTFLTEIGLPPIIENVNAIEYSKINYPVIIKNYDSIECSPASVLSLHHL